MELTKKLKNDLIEFYQENDMNLNDFFENEDYNNMQVFETVEETSDYFNIDISGLTEIEDIDERLQDCNYIFLPNGYYYCY